MPKSPEDQKGPGESYKDVTRATYDAVADGYAARDRESVDESLDVFAALEEFAAAIPEGGKILDVGCAAGRDSQYFFKKGFKVVGIDFSPELIERARRLEPRIDYRLEDFEELSYGALFDGVWANASLHHVPKRNLPAVLASLERALRPGGIAFFKVKHGTHEGIRNNMKFGITIRRYFAYYENDEFERLITESGLAVLTIRNTTAGEWVEAIAKKSRS